MRHALNYCEKCSPSTKEERMDAWRSMGFALSSCPGAPDPSYLTPGPEDHNIMLAEVLLKEKMYKTLQILVGLKIMNIFDAVCFMAWSVTVKKALGPNGERSDADELASILDWMMIERFIRRRDQSYGEVWSITLKGARMFGIKNVLNKVVLK